MFVNVWEFLRNVSIHILLHYLCTICQTLSMKFLIISLDLLIDHGVVSEGEHSEPPSQKKKSDNGNPSDFHYAVI